MDISYRKLPGLPALGIEFFWSLKIAGSRPGALSDHFIPELCYDYIFIQRGQIAWVDLARDTQFTLPRQTLRGLFTQPFVFNYSTPLVLFGARLSLSFAETFWEPRAGANAFWEQAWVGRPPRDLATFAAQVTRYVQARRAPKCPHPMLGLGLEESEWLRSFSPRHRRRMYLSVFGASRQAMERVRGLHVFLEQLCDFERRMPRILGHVDPDVFYDQPHLNRVFKKMTGLTPLEYFGTPARLQDNLMAASYNALASESVIL